MCFSLALRLCSMWGKRNVLCLYFFHQKHLFLFRLSSVLSANLPYFFRIFPPILPIFLSLKTYLFSAWVPFYPLTCPTFSVFSSDSAYFLVLENDTFRLSSVLSANLPYFFRISPWFCIFYCPWKTISFPLEFRFIRLTWPTLSVFSATSVYFLQLLCIFCDFCVFLHFCVFLYFCNFSVFSATLNGLFTLKHVVFCPF